MSGVEDGRRGGVPRAAQAKIRSVEDLAREMEDARREGRRIVLANGVFDILHVGHARLLGAARAAGDLLVVAVNDDASARRLKGEGRPLVPLAERMECVAALASVDRVVAFGEDTACEVIRRLRPDLHAKGPDWTPETVPEAAAVREVGARTIIVGGERTRSTSWIVARTLDGGGGGRG